MAKVVILTNNSDLYGTNVTYSTNLSNVIKTTQTVSLALNYRVYGFCSKIAMGYKIMSTMESHFKNGINHIAITQHTVKAIGTWDCIELLERKGSGDVIQDCYTFIIDVCDLIKGKEVYRYLTNSFTSGFFVLFPQEPNQMITLWKFFEPWRMLNFPFNHAELIDTPISLKNRPFLTSGVFDIQISNGSITQLDYNSQNCLVNVYQNSLFCHLHIITTKNNYNFHPNNHIEAIIFSIYQNGFPSCSFIRERQSIKYEKKEGLIFGSEVEIIEKFLSFYFKIFKTNYYKVHTLVMEKHSQMFIYFIERLIFLGVFDDNLLILKDSIEHGGFNSLSPIIEIETCKIDGVLYEDYLSSLQVPPSNAIIKTKKVTIDMGMTVFDSRQLIANKRGMFKHLDGLTSVEFISIPYIVEEMIKAFKNLDHETLQKKNDANLKLSNLTMMDTTKLELTLNSHLAKSALFKFYLNHNYILLNSGVFKSKILLNTGNVINHPKFKFGGFTFAKAGIYENVGQIDFTSFYPSIVEYFNLSFWTCGFIKKNVKLTDNIKNAFYVLPFDKDEDYSFLLLKDPSQFNLPTLGDFVNIFKEIDDCIKRKKKLIINSLLGEFGNEYSEYYTNALYNAITFLGRKVIQYTTSNVNELCRRKNKKVNIEDILYCKKKINDSVVRVDTDGFSIMVKDDETFSNYIKHINLLFNGKLLCHIEKSPGRSIIFHSKEYLHESSENDCEYLVRKTWDLPPKPQDSLKIKRIKVLYAKQNESSTAAGTPDLTTRNGFINFCREYSADELVVASKMKLVNRGNQHLKYSYLKLLQSNSE